MNRHLRSIRSKLSEAELSYLKDEWGLELRDPEVVAALSELDAAWQRLEVFAAATRSSHSNSGEPLTCAFCGRTANTAGPLVQAPTRTHICSDCASHCLALLRTSRTDHSGAADL
jgi:hypothetical protein